MAVGAGGLRTDPGSGPVTAGMAGHSKPASSQLVADNVDLSYYLCT
jgi:hypothetical protein